MTDLSLIVSLVSLTVTTSCLIYTRRARKQVERLIAEDDL